MICAIVFNSMDHGPFIYRGMGLFGEGSKYDDKLGFACKKIVDMVDLSDIVVSSSRLQIIDLHMHFDYLDEKNGEVYFIF